MAKIPATTHQFQRLPPMLLPSHIIAPNFMAENPIFSQNETNAQVSSPTVVVVSLGWFSCENLNRKPMVFYHQIGWAFR